MFRRDHPDLMNLLPESCRSRPTAMGRILLYRKIIPLPVKGSLFIQKALYVAGNHFLHSIHVR